MYDLSATMKLVMFMEAYLWHALDSPLRLPDRLATNTVMLSGPK